MDFYRHSYHIFHSHCTMFNRAITFYHTLLSFLSFFFRQAVCLKKKNSSICKLPMHCNEKLYHFPSNLHISLSLAVPCYSILVFCFIQFFSLRTWHRRRGSFVKHRKLLFYQRGKRSFDYVHLMNTK